MRDSLDREVLKGVSRSFYLSLRMLPRPMRGGASLAYLLARTSDTLADTEGVSASVRLDCLARWRALLCGGSGVVVDWPAELLDAVVDPRERLLLDRSGELLRWLNEISENERMLIRELLEIIIGGQALDLERFADASAENPVALADSAALEDYAWRVAGCVGAFWTKLGFLTLGDGFSGCGEFDLLERGVAYGKGLQLVNILRDLPADLAAGRCYLPVGCPEDRAALLASHAVWCVQAQAWVAEGEKYAKSLHSGRLRAASVLPALIAQETLESMCGVSWEGLRARVKIPRRRVYCLIIKAVVSFSYGK